MKTNKSLPVPAGVVNTHIFDASRSPAHMAAMHVAFPDDKPGFIVSHVYEADCEDVAQVVVAVDHGGGMSITDGARFYWPALAEQVGFELVGSLKIEHRAGRGAMQGTDVVMFASDGQFIGWRPLSRLERTIVTRMLMTTGEVAVA